MRNSNFLRHISWLKVFNPSVSSRLGQIRHVLFDFDGTISVLREGWEEVMKPLMVEMICGNTSPLPDIEREVQEYIDISTGILTIEQMQWLVETVWRHGLAGEPKTAAEYKTLYLQRLNVSVRQRLARLSSGEIQPVDQMVRGALRFLNDLVMRGATLYLASGTDHFDVVNEAEALGLTHFFTGGVYGALDSDITQNKAQVIQSILSNHHLQGNELMIVGDGPVEIREAVVHGAIALGVASDEIMRSGWNRRKIRRLTEAGSDLMIPDFTHDRALSYILFGE